MYFFFFYRSISVPGPAPNLENLSIESESRPTQQPQNISKSNQHHRNFSFNANSGQRPHHNPLETGSWKPETGNGHSSSRNRGKLKRSETERLVQNPVANTAPSGVHAGSSNNLWVSQFDNHAYEKSPEPLLLNSASTNLPNSHKNVTNHQKSLSLNR